MVTDLRYAQCAGGAAGFLQRIGRELPAVPAALHVQVGVEGEVGEKARSTKTMIKAVHPCVVAVAILLLPATAFAQRSGDPAYIERQLSGLQQQLADLSARIKELRIQEQQLQQRLDNMRSNFEARLGQQENGAKGKTR